MPSKSERLAALRERRERRNVARRADEPGFRLLWLDDPETAAFAIYDALERRGAPVPNPFLHMPRPILTPMTPRGRQN